VENSPLVTPRLLVQRNWHVLFEVCKVPSRTVQPRRKVGRYEGGKNIKYFLRTRTRLVYVHRSPFSRMEVEGTYPSSLCTSRRLTRETQHTLNCIYFKQKSARPQVCNC
jgi:hypothetical protein